MLSDEERKAIERIDYIQDFIIENGQYNADVNDMQYFSKVLNIIEKQSKELEQLKDIQQQICNEELIEQKYVKENYIAKDKIKAKIEDKESQINDIRDNLDYDEVMVNEVKRLENEIEVLQSLLEKE